MSSLDNAFIRAFSHDPDDKKKKQASAHESLTAESAQSGSPNQALAQPHVEIVNNGQLTDDQWYRIERPVELASQPLMISAPHIRLPEESVYGSEQTLANQPALEPESHMKDLGLHVADPTSNPSITATSAHEATFVEVPHVAVTPTAPAEVPVQEVPSQISLGEDGAAVELRLATDSAETEETEPAATEPAATEPAATEAADTEAADTLGRIAHHDDSIEEMLLSDARMLVDVLPEESLRLDAAPSVYVEFFQPSPTPDESVDISHPSASPTPPAKSHRKEQPESPELESTELEATELEATELEATELESPEQESPEQESPEQESTEQRGKSAEAAIESSAQNEPPSLTALFAESVILNPGQWTAASDLAMAPTDLSIGEVTQDVRGDELALGSDRREAQHDDAHLDPADGAHFAIEESPEPMESLAASASLESGDGHVAALEQEQQRPVGPAFAPVWEVDQFCYPVICEQLDLAANSCFDDTGAKLAAATAEGLNVLAVTSSRPGEGSSTLTLCLARSAARHGIRVAVVDCSLQSPVLGDAVGLEAPCTWHDFALGRLPLSEVAIVSLADDVTLFPLAASSAAAEDGFCLAARHIQKRIAEMSEQFDLLILDLGHLEGCAMLNGDKAPSDDMPLDAVLLVRDVRSADSGEVAGSIQKLRDAGIEAIGLADNFGSGQAAAG